MLNTQTRQLLQPTWADQDLSGIIPIDVQSVLLGVKLSDLS